MLDPILALGALAALFLRVPMAPALDPGPSAECPGDMRLVAGTHYDEVSHECLEPRKDTKDTHCFAYWEDMTIVEGQATEIQVCMDQYEAPNVRGARPLVMKSFDDAQRFCTARKKRVCSEQEWELACEGGEFRPLAYGWRVDTTQCNSDKQWIKFDAAKLYKPGPDADAELARLWQGTPSGTYLSCASKFGIFDMMGNVEEWVTTRNGRRFPGALMGGFWAKPWTGCRGTNDAHEPGFKFYETGFRCCADPGKEGGERRNEKKSGAK